ncbi:unnamed protein product [Caenorhabditis bovis]|uniref:CWF21 domain-containing protein n=1 Tax=Caenorhabditis bovis TaxID=2654633 RepID=A0A8S1EVP4_9PELO|nr:unnamed protein product [Caenorhabditis bovis]
MYNGIGLQTARGSGTNGYVQSNLSHLLNTRRKIEYNGEEDLKRMEAELNRKPNEEILDHNRKRQIELKCVEFEQVLEDKGFDEDEIDRKVGEYRKKLLEQLESGELDVDEDLDTRDTHARRKAAAKNRDRMRSALGLGDDFVAGSSMAKMNKSDVVGAALNAEPVAKQSEKDALLEKLNSQKKSKKSKHDSSSSSKSSSSSSSSESEDEKEKKERQKKRKSRKELENRRNETKRREKELLNEKEIKREPESPEENRRRYSHDEDDKEKINKHHSDQNHSEKVCDIIVVRDVSDMKEARAGEEVLDTMRGEVEMIVVASETDRDNRAKKPRIEEDIDGVPIKLEPPSDDDRPVNPNRSPVVEPRQPMGHLDKEDLLDVIRHELRLEDEDGPGLCNRVLLPVSRRAKHGGLPLNFRKTHAEEDDDCYDDIYEIPLYEEPLHTRNIINENMAERTEEKIKEEKRVEDNVYQGDIRELFIRREVVLPLKIPDGPSAIQKYLDENADHLNCSLGDFMQFGASNGTSSKKIAIIFGDTNRRLNISVVPTARVREVIGYCMLRYQMEFDETLPGEVDDYQFFLAEDDGEIESELPALDSTKIIGQLGFDCLGLINTRELNRERNTTKLVVVYFVDKDQYTIEVDNLERPMRWLKDEAMRLRSEKKKTTEEDGLNFVLDYYMEPVDKFDSIIDLDSSIASTRCFEFVMILKNSSRGGFHPRGARYGKQMSAMLTLKLPNSPIPAASTTPLPTVLEGEGESSFKLSSPVQWSDNGGQLSCFKVTRVHKIKPNWKAKLILRWTCLEIERYSTDRTSFLPQGYQKHSKVFWEYVGGVRVQKKEYKPTRVDTWQITIFWLPQRSDTALQNIVGDNDWSLKNIAQLYENEEAWSRVTVETTNKEDAEQIESQINSMLSARDSSIYKTFLHSAFGKKPPAQSADMAMIDSGDVSYIAAVRDPPKSGAVRKLSKMIISPLTGVIRKSTTE